MNLSGIANLDPSGMVGRIYLENHSELLYAKYLSSGHHGFKKSNHKYTGATDFQGVASFNHVGLIT